MAESALVNAPELPMPAHPSLKVLELMWAKMTAPYSVLRTTPKGRPFKI